MLTRTRLRTCCRPLSSRTARWSSGLLVVVVLLTGCAVGASEVDPQPFPATGCPASGPAPSASALAHRSGDGIAGSYVPEAIRTGEVVDGRCPDYPSFPPAAGEMAAEWANCGYYESPVPPANAVHSLYNGAVWIAYAPDLDAASREVIRATATRSAQVLASPVDGLPSPVVLSAWKRQLQLDDVEDPRFDEFVDANLYLPDRPMPYASCRNGVGRPAASMWSGGPDH